MAPRTVIVVALTCLCCARNPAPNESEPTGRTAIPSLASAAAAAGSAAPAVGSAPPAPTPPTALQHTTLPGYPPVAKRLTEPCDDPHAVLAVRKRWDRSGRIWVQQALLAHPEFVVKAERAEAPMEVDFYETIYGVKRFKSRYPGDPLFSEAVIARCRDADTCHRLAAMFQAVSPSDRPEVVCGAPPATTGGFARVKELAADQRVLPDGSDPVAACARFSACAARVGAPERVRKACAVKSTATRACASETDCGRVLECLKTRAL